MRHASKVILCSVMIFTIKMEQFVYTRYTEDYYQNFDVLKVTVTMTILSRLHPKSDNLREGQSCPGEHKRFFDELATILTVHNGNRPSRGGKISLNHPLPKRVQVEE